MARTSETGASKHAGDKEPGERGHAEGRAGSEQGSNQRLEPHAAEEVPGDASLPQLGMAALAGVAVAAIEAELLPGLLIGVGAMLAPKLVPGVGKVMRPLGKILIRIGYEVAEKAQEIVAEASEQVQDLVAEIKTEKAAGQTGAEHRPSASTPHSA
jgi:hypothetical protein